MNEKQQLLLLQNSPNDGIRSAMTTFAPLVKCIVGRILPQQQQEIEECIADVFLALWQNAPHMARDAVPMKAWLAVTARNKAIDRYRKLHSVNFVELNEDFTDDRWLYFSASTDAEDSVQAMVVAMSPPDQDIFIRKYYAMQTSHEIAQALSMTEDAVNQRLSRGRQKLKQQLMAQGVR